MFTVRVRDHIMIAHSFRGAVFGPAQKLHGATFVVDLELRRATLDENGIVCDIGLLHDVLKATLEPLNYRNLDDEERFAGRNTTTEVLARHVYDEVVRRAAGGDLGEGVGEALKSIKVTLHESHVASASFEGPAAGTTA